jgi:hypothetical protein
MQLIGYRNMTAESVTLVQIRDAAIQVEENNRIAVQLGMGSLIPGRSTTRKDADIQDRTSGLTREERQRRREDYTSRRQLRHERRAMRDSRTPQDYQREHPVPERKDHTRPVEAQAAGNSRPLGNPARRPRGPPGNPRTPLAEVECYACHKLGHYASDPICEKYGQPRITAMAIEPNDDLSAERPSSERSRSPSDQSMSSGTHSLSTRAPSRLQSLHDLDRYKRASTASSHLSLYSSESSEGNSESDSTHTVRLAGMQLSEYSLAPMTVDITAQKVRTPYKGDGKDPNVYDSNIRRKNSHVQPVRTPDSQRVMTALININGSPAWTMFDTGSTADCVSPEFARVNNFQVFDLDSPVPLQLGTKGSKSSIVYGTNVEVSPHTTVRTVEYLDIVNIDRYDAILGTPYMAKQGVVLDLLNRTITFASGLKLQALNTEHEAGHRMPAQKCLTNDEKPQDVFASIRGTWLSQTPIEQAYEHVPLNPHSRHQGTFSRRADATAGSFSPYKPAQKVVGQPNGTA